MAHESEFATLRYFRRRGPSGKGEAPSTTVANLSEIFGTEDDTTRFVKRFLRSTHCDVFFADGLVLVEGQAERILVPHFIRHHFPELSRRYITILEIGGSHAHKFRPLIDAIGVHTLIVSDLDAVSLKKVTNKLGQEQSVWKSSRPAVGAAQKTQNPVLKSWHPKREFVDELSALSGRTRSGLTGTGMSCM